MRPAGLDGLPGRSGDEADSSSCSISFDGVMLELQSTRGGGWSLNKQDLAVIGELTNSQGPVADDYFLVVVDQECNWYEAPMGARGMESVCKDLERSLDARFYYRLPPVTELDSNVLWPKMLAGQSLFVFTCERRTLWERLLHFWISDVFQVALADHVRRYILKKRSV
jgi:hypothetical protein